jgi:hypothetical protein
MPLICSPRDLPSSLGTGIWQHGSPPGSPFNIAWGCHMQAGGVKESEFCLFMVVFPARCISRVSPRVYVRKHAFCFLPLVANMESPQYPLIKNHLICELTKWSL